jgi:serine/threonine-protein kinase HipA
MRTAKIYQQGEFAGTLEELDERHYRLAYAPSYNGEPISLALPVREAAYEFDNFPAVFEGLLPEGVQLEALLRHYKVDRHDMFRQLLIVGEDVVWSLTVREAE